MIEEARTLFRDIASTFPDATMGKLFGAECFKAPNGKAVAFFYRGHMVFKLTGEAETETLSWDGTALFCPDNHRPMKGWIQVSYDYKEQWPSLAEAAMVYVSSLPPNQKKKK